jgi:hypothetical protein
MFCMVVIVCTSSPELITVVRPMVSITNEMDGEGAAGVKGDDANDGKGDGDGDGDGAKDEERDGGGKIPVIRGGAWSFPWVKVCSGGFCTSGEGRGCAAVTATIAEGEGGAGAV